MQESSSLPRPEVSLLVSLAGASESGSPARVSHLATEEWAGRDQSCVGRYF